MSFLGRKLIQYGGKVIKDNPDFGNPITVDAVEFAVTIGKGAFKLAKELLL